MRDLIACPDCGLIQRLTPGSEGCLVECARCALVLARPARDRLELSLALAVAALMLMLPGALAPLLRLHAFGQTRMDWLSGGMQGLWHQGYAVLATVAGVFSLAIPLVYLGLHVWVLAAIRRGATARLGVLFRWARQLRPWAMLDVYLVGSCVAYSRLEAIGPVGIGIGGWCLAGAALSMALMTLCLDERTVWDALPVRSHSGADAPWIGCGVCALVLPARLAVTACPRCGAGVYRRKLDSMQRTFALVLAASLLYVPAMVLPVLRLDRFGRALSNTILGGVTQLLASKSWLLAAIVFIASVLVPLIKLIGLGTLLLLTALRSRRWLRGRIRLYRLIDLAGPWSAIDLFVIAILTASVQFGTLLRISPQAGASAFAAVVVITLLASRSFDPRIMWDAAGVSGESRAERPAP